MAVTESYILAVQELHFGYLKETFHKGCVISYDDEGPSLIIDGRRFGDVRDFEILKRQAERTPNNPFIVPFSEEMIKKLRSSDRPVVLVRKPRPGENMKVIQSDEDLHGEIDISATKIASTKQAERDANRNVPKEKDAPMEVVRGDENPAERRERLNEEKRVRDLKVVEDDGALGYEGGSPILSRNAGQKLPNREEVEAKKAAASDRAAKRKAEINSLRGKQLKAELEVGKIESAENTVTKPIPMGTVSEEPSEKLTKASEKATTRKTTRKPRQSRKTPVRQSKRTTRASKTNSVESQEG